MSLNEKEIESIERYHQHLRDVAEHLSISLTEAAAIYIAALIGAITAENRAFQKYQKKAIDLSVRQMEREEGGDSWQEPE